MIPIRFLLRIEFSGPHRKVVDRYWSPVRTRGMQDLNVQAQERADRLIQEEIESTYRGNPPEFTVALYRQIPLSSKWTRNESI